MAEPARQTSSAQAEPGPFLESLEEVSEAVESGAGLPEVTRAAGRALDASVIVLDAAGSVLAVACASTEDERVVMAGEAGGRGGREGGRGGCRERRSAGGRRPGRPAALPHSRRAAARLAAAPGRQPDR